MTLSVKNAHSLTFVCQYITEIAQFALINYVIVCILALIPLVRVSLCSLFYVTWLMLPAP